MIRDANAHVIKTGNVTLDVSVPARRSPDDQEPGEDGPGYAEYTLVRLCEPFIDRRDEEGCDQDSSRNIPEGHPGIMDILTIDCKGLK